VHQICHDQTIYQRQLHNNKDPEIDRNHHCILKSHVLYGDVKNKTGIFTSRLLPEDQDNLQQASPKATSHLFEARCTLALSQTYVKRSQRISTSNPNHIFITKYMNSTSKPAHVDLLKGKKLTKD